MTELFVQVVRSWDHDRQATLLQFVTGSSQLPAGARQPLTAAGGFHSNLFAQVVSNA